MCMVGVLSLNPTSHPDDSLHHLVYDIDNLNHISNLNVGSTPLAISYDALRNHIFMGGGISPSSLLVPKIILKRMDN